MDGIVCHVDNAVLYKAAAEKIFIVLSGLVFGYLWCGGVTQGGEGHFEIIFPIHQGCLNPLFFECLCDGYTGKAAPYDEDIGFNGHILFYLSVRAIVNYRLGVLK